jgi:hypothetical protein
MAVFGIVTKDVNIATAPKAVKDFGRRNFSGPLCVIVKLLRH